MRKFLIVGVALIALTLAGSSPAAADGACRQAAQAALIEASDEGTRGDFMSDVIFGNEPNIVGPFAPGGPEEQEPGTQAGRVVSSQSPGPFVNAGPNEPPRNDRGPHGFGGDEMAALLNAACD